MFATDDDLLSDARRYPERSALAAGLSGRCPRCGEGAMFASALTLATRCEDCGLDFGFDDVSDGPAVFVALVAGFCVLGAAVAFDIVFEPAIWVYFVIFLPLALFVCLGVLRPVKGMMAAARYKNQAHYGGR